MASQRTTVTGNKRKRLANKKATKVAKANHKAGKVKSEAVRAKRAEQRANDPTVQARKVCHEAAAQANAQKALTPLEVIKKALTPLEVIKEHTCECCVSPDAAVAPAAPSATPTAAVVTPTTTPLDGPTNPTPVDSQPVNPTPTPE